ncbi:hypothetical protein [Terriglobus sp. RCC_193]|uniref:hypothetical protein n=1 Tax=Terriglobus sp. RCC_193 TaxID=3239218 RepID=UPI0035252083
MSKVTTFNLILGTCLILPVGTKTISAQVPTDSSATHADWSTPERELQRLTKTLKLTDQQRAQILPVLRDRSDSIKRIFGDRDAPMHDRYPKIVEIIDRSNAQIRAMLIEPQQKKFDKMIAEEKKQQESGPDDGPPPGDMPPPPPNS